MSDPFVTIKQFKNPFQADMACTVLRSHGIAARLKDENMVWTHSLMASALGMIKLQAPADRADEAMRLLAEPAPETHPSPPRAGDSGTGAEDMDRCLRCGGEMEVEDDTCPACGWTYRSAKGQGQR
jgi:ribosomal protein L37E